MNGALVFANPIVAVSGSVLIAWQFTNWEQGGTWWDSGAPTRLTVPTGLGERLYRLEGWVTENGTAAGQLDLELLVNGGVGRRGKLQRPGSFASVSQYVGQAVPLNDGDFVELRSVDGSGSNRTIEGGAAQTGLSVYEVGAGAGNGGDVQDVLDELEEIKRRLGLPLGRTAGGDYAEDVIRMLGLLLQSGGYPVVIEDREDAGAQPLDELHYKITEGPAP